MKSCIYRNATDRLTEEMFKEKYRVRQCEICCATCKYGVDMCDDGCYWCKHPAVKDESLYTSESMVCEVWEAADAMANGDTAHAVEECYDAIAVLLRTIDVLEGRQKLGKPETISGNPDGKQQER